MIDLWIIDKFNVLPTDKRFVDLYDEQKIALFEGVSILPDQKDLKANILYTKKIEEIKNKPDKEFINDGLKKRMIEQYKASGFSDIEISEKIKNIVETKRSLELKELEKYKNGG
jgi:hypothetical protein